jgi:hypothetical protein
MKRFLLAGLLLLSACYSDGLETRTTDNEKFKIEMLFTVEGCRVYRFFDAGRSHYFSRCSNTSSAVTSTKDCGKGCTYPEEIRTEEDCK